MLEHCIRAIPNNQKSLPRPLCIYIYSYYKGSIQTYHVHIVYIYSIIYIYICRLHSFTYLNAHGPWMLIEAPFSLTRSPLCTGGRADPASSCAICCSAFSREDFLRTPCWNMGNWSIPRNLQQDPLNGPLNLSIQYSSSTTYLGVRW